MHPFYRINPETLETMGVETMDGVLRGQNMLAHTRVDPERQRLVACALEYQAVDQANLLHFYEFDTNGKLVADREYRASPAVVFHDWMITPNYYIVPAAEASFDLAKLPQLLLGRIPATGVFSLDESAPAKVLLIPRHNPQEAVTEARMDTGETGAAFHRNLFSIYLSLIGINLVMKWAFC